MRIALVHDWLTGMRGGEKVLEALCELFPEADLYTLVHIKGSVSPIIEERKIFISFIQHLPDIERKYRYYLPLMPKAIERFDLSKYELVVSSSHCVAKGVKVGEKVLHICYCHTPMRYIWDMYTEYFGNAKIHIKALVKILRKYLQRWDVESSKRVSYFIANSENVRKRIHRCYNRDAEVIHPPVDTNFFTPSDLDARGKSYYLIVSAFAPYKKIDLAIEAFNLLRYPLKIIGNGQEEKKLKSIAKENIEFLGWLSNEGLKKYYQNCKALIFPAEEDFGIVPVEAQACGAPVIAFGKGGVTETVIPFQNTQPRPLLSEVEETRNSEVRTRNPQLTTRNLSPTGIFFYEQTPRALIDAIKRFEAIENKFNPHEIRKNAERFSIERFKREFKNFLDEKIKLFNG